MKSKTFRVSDFAKKKEKVSHFTSLIPSQNIQHYFREQKKFQLRGFFDSPEEEVTDETFLSSSVGRLSDLKRNFFFSQSICLSCALISARQREREKRIEIRLLLLSFASRVKKEAFLLPSSFRSRLFLSFRPFARRRPAKAKKRPTQERPRKKAALCEKRESQKSHVNEFIRK